MSALEGSFQIADKPSMLSSHFLPTILQVTDETVTTSLKAVFSTQTSYLYTDMQYICSKTDTLMQAVATHPKLAIHVGLLLHNNLMANLQDSQTIYEYPDFQQFVDAILANRPWRKDNNKD